MKIRMANESDRDGICLLADEINLTHFDNMPKYFSKPPQDGSDWWYWKASYEKDGGFVLVCEVDENIIGFVAAQTVNTPKLPFLNSMKRCLISTIVVSKKCHRQGVGSQLIARVAEVAKERGASDLGLEVMAFNRGAREFYIKLGFDCFSERLSKSIS